MKLKSKGIRKNKPKKEKKKKIPILKSDYKQTRYAMRDKTNIKYNEDSDENEDENKKHINIQDDDKLILSESSQ